MGCVCVHGIDGVSIHNPPPNQTGLARLEKLAIREKGMGDGKKKKVVVMLMPIHPASLVAPSTFGPRLMYQSTTTQEEDGGRWEWVKTLAALALTSAWTALKTVVRAWLVVVRSCRGV
jgi:hypothetical protein